MNHETSESSLNIVGRVEGFIVEILYKLSF